MFSLIWKLFLVGTWIIGAAIVYGIWGIWPFVGLVVLVSLAVLVGYNASKKADALHGPAGVCEHARTLYGQLSIGQTYSEACLLAGHRGRMEYQTNYRTGTSGGYNWADGEGNVVYASFSNGQLEYKSYFPSDERAS